MFWKEYSVQNSIKVSTQTKVGKPLVYPECENAKAFSRLMGRKTFNTADLHIIKNILGFTIIEVKNEK